ncbi:hypothetical protein DN745_13870 [Bradymonas sediminis]|uniref:Uncharacterized protein n=1 Tax=Bradymonas sediminis TaxID=1548548 RepID=A0A2Z4FN03_9DELT|nr:hypothetical protein DN745_13870 [Bradymonas sediminis]
MPQKMNRHSSAHLYVLGGDSVKYIRGGECGPNWAKVHDPSGAIGVCIGVVERRLGREDRGRSSRTTGQRNKCRLNFAFCRSDSEYFAVS